MENKSITICGAPSLLGGADTECLSAIILWRMHDVDVTIMPMFGLLPEMKKDMEDIGCHVLAYDPALLKDRIIASWCNGEFLRLLPEIIEKGRPKCVVWFNSMTWLFDLEKVAHKNGWIDYHGFVSNYQKGWLKPELEKIAPVRELEGYRPYFDPQNKSQKIEFKYRPPEQWFALGRLSRDDSNKFSSDMWNLFYKVCTPKHKKIFVLGYGPNAHAKTGPAPGALNSEAPEVVQLRKAAAIYPQIQHAVQSVLKLQGNWVNGIDWQSWAPGDIHIKEFYNLLHCIVHKTGGSRESYCRIVPEAYAFGVPMIVEDDYAFPDLVVDGVTGYRCKTSDEMSYRASELAFDEEKRRKMIFAAREFLINEIANKDKCWEPWRKLFEEQGV